MDRENGRSVKKFRNESGAAVSVGRSERDDRYSHKVAPSPVVHVRGLPEHVDDSDLHDAGGVFGTVSCVMQIPNRRMALIEFEDIEAATDMVKYAEKHTVYVGEHPAQFNYSTSSRIKRPETDFVQEPNSVILLSISNARHPITVEVINAISCPFGTVCRIVIFRKNGVQAMVEFDNIDTAAKAKDGLQGQDIYAGCCTVKTEYAKPTVLNVRKNDNDTWDFTVNSFSSPPGQKNRPLLAEPRYGAGPTPFAHLGGGELPRGRGGHYESHSASGGMLGRYGGGYSGSGAEAYEPGGGYYPSQMGAMNPYESACASVTSGSNPDCVLMVYEMDSKIFNCQRLFNLFCIYGNVIRVKFLKSKEGAAMVQMGDREACYRVTSYLAGTKCFGRNLSISMSKQPFLQEVYNPHRLDDGSSAYADYSTTRNQRYSTPEAAIKNRPVAPTSSLYFYNAPPGVSEETLSKVFTDVDVLSPSRICIFPPRSEKSSRGLMQWETVEECTDALICGNHGEIPNPSGGRVPFVLKLAFSQSVID